MFNTKSRTLNYNNKIITNYIMYYEKIKFSKRRAVFVIMLGNMHD